MRARTIRSFSVFFLFLFLLFFSNLFFVCFLYQPYSLLGDWGSLAALLLLELVFCVLPMPDELFDRGRIPQLLFLVLLPFALYVTPMAAMRSPVFFLSALVGPLLMVLFPAVRLVLSLLDGWGLDHYLSAFLRRARAALTVALTLSLLTFVFSDASLEPPSLSPRQEAAAVTVLDPAAAPLPLDYLEEARWAELERDTQKRLSVLHAACSRYAQAMNIPMPGLVTAHLEEDTLGSYSFWEDLIRIDESYLAECTAYRGLQTALHELRHAYQRRLVEAWKEDPAAYASAESYARQLEACFEDYVDGQEDYESYKAQFCEVDARDWAEDAAEELLASLGVETAPLAHGF